MGIMCYICRRKASKRDRISLHKFPKDPLLRNKWIEVCNLSTSDNLTNIYICSLHFAPNVIDRGFEFQSRCILKSGAVPSIGVPNAISINDEYMNIENNLNINIAEANEVEMNNAIIEHITSKELPLPTNTANKVQFELGDDFIKQNGLIVTNTMMDSPENLQTTVTRHPCEEYVNLLYCEVLGIFSSPSILVQLEHNYHFQGARISDSTMNSTDTDENILNPGECGSNAINNDEFEELETEFTEDCFCICCLDRESQLISLEECKHSIYMDIINLPELKEYKQLVCVHCHNVLMKIKCFRDQVQECHEILMCGTFTVSTPHQRKLNKLTMRETLHTVLPISLELWDEVVPNASNMEENKNVKTEFSDYTVRHSLNVDEIYIKPEPSDSAVYNISKIEENKDIKTSFEVIDSNSQRFDKKYLSSILNPSLGKEVLPSSVIEFEVPTLTNTITMLPNELINSREIPEMPKDTKMVFLSESLDSRLDSITEHIESIDDFEEEPMLARTGHKRKIFSRQNNPIKLKKITDLAIKTVKLSKEELNTERMSLSQSESNLKYKFRFFSNMERNKDERNRKRKIADTADDENKKREERLQKARERSKRHREKKRNKDAAMVIGGLTDADKEKREERLRYDREKSKRYREKKKNEVAAHSFSDFSSDSSRSKMKKDRQKQNSKRYRDKKRTSNLLTPNISNRKNVSHNIHSSQIAGPSTRDVLYVPPIFSN